jgi:hypothetical protein
LTWNDPPYCTYTAVPGFGNCLFSRGRGRWIRRARRSAGPAALLSRGADPDRTHQQGNTALLFAIQSGVLPTIETLTRVTNNKLGEALYLLARERVEVTPGILGLVQRAGGTGRPSCGG